MITHLEPDILECEVKWALGNITMNKASGDDAIPVELFQILKDDAVKVLHSLCQQIWKTQQWPQDWKRSVFISVSKTGNAKECSNRTMCSFHMPVRLCSKSFKLGFISMWTKIQRYKLGFEEVEEPEIKLLTFAGSWGKRGSSRKTSINTCASLTTLKPLTVWITTNCGKSLMRWEHQTTLPASWKTCMQVKKKQLGPDKEQWTGSKLGKEYVNAAYCHLAYLTYMQSISCRMTDWMNHKLESRLLGETATTLDMQMTFLP